MRDAVAAQANVEFVDVVIVGAGLSGIGAAVHLQQRRPGQRFAILEARHAIGGTWDLFRYPGVRSDSDMHTLGYAFKPWLAPEAMADGTTIRRYIEETAREHDLHAHIRFGQRVVRARWSSADACWTLDIECGPSREPTQLRCRVIDFCAGYYRYDTAHRPHWDGESRFTGAFVHPQFWPDGLEVAGRRVLVVGSGATAVTLVPALVAQGARVTMLQRSPSDVMALPRRDPVAKGLKRWLPAMWAYRLVRTRNVLFGQMFFQAARRWPQAIRGRLMRDAAKQLGPAVDVRTHFNPRYDPWDQRLCIAPDGDLFAALRAGKAHIVTGEIGHFTEWGAALRSGESISADIVVTATGLELCLLGDTRVEVDGEAIDLSRRLVYKGMMFDGVPNLVSTFGYTNASWTLKADLTAGWLCRLLDHLDRHGLRTATPHASDDVNTTPFLDFSSGYVQRAAAVLPKQGDRMPWRVRQNYLLDLLSLRFAKLRDGALRFGR